MAIEIFKLIGSIFVNNEEANQSISKTDEAAQSVGKTLADGVGKAAKWGTAIIGGASAAVGAITGLATQTAAAAGDIDDAAQRVGIGVEEYQKLSYAAQIGGASTQTLEAAAKKLATTLPEANIADVIQELAAMTNEEERTAKAIDLLGKTAAYELTPMLNMGANGIKDMMSECENLGMVMSQDTVAAGATLGDTIDSIKGSFGGMVAQLGASVMPIVQTFANLIKDNLPVIQEMFAKLAPVVTNLLDKLLPPLIELAEMLLPIIIELIETLLPPLTDVISAVLPVIVELLGTILPPLTEVVKAVLPALVTVINTLTPILTLVIDLLKPILDIVLSLLAPIINLISSAITPIIEVLGSLINTILQPIIPIIETLAGILTKVLGVAFENIKTVIDSVMGVFRGLINFITGIFTGNWEKAFGGLKDIVSNIFGALTSIIKAPINFLIDGLNAFIGMLNKIKIPDWVPGVGGKGIDLPLIPKLAKGGIVGNGQLFIANEEAPEMVGTYDGKSAVVNNQQIVQAITAAVTNALTAFLAELSTVFSQGGDNTGDIIIPVYLGGELIDEALITAKDRINFRSGGRANV